jgi:hypothetical protein
MNQAPLSGIAQNISFSRRNFTELSYTIVQKGLELYGPKDNESWEP